MRLLAAARVASSRLTRAFQWCSSPRGDWYTVAAFDGDGLADTPADPGTAYHLLQGWDPCAGTASFSIDGHHFSPDRHNSMSYFACAPMGFSAEQTALLRQTALTRFGSCSEFPQVEVPELIPIKPDYPDPRQVGEPGQCRRLPQQSASGLLALTANQLVLPNARSGDSNWVRVMPLALEPRSFGEGGWEEFPGPAIDEFCWVPVENLRPPADRTWLDSLPTLPLSTLSCSVPEAVAVGEPFSVQISLSPAAEGASIQVEVSLDGTIVQPDVAALTDINGQASAQIQPLTTPGNYEVVAKPAGGPGQLGATSPPCLVEAVIPAAQITGHRFNPSSAYYRSEAAHIGGLPASLCSPGNDQRPGDRR